MPASHFRFSSMKIKALCDGSHLIVDAFTKPRCKVRYLTPQHPYSVTKANLADVGRNT